MAEKNPKAATPATPAKKVAVEPTKTVPKGRQNTEYDVPAPKTPPEPTEAEKEAKKAQEASLKAEAEAQTKAGKINEALARKGDSRRVLGGVRHGKPVFHWGNFVPTMELTEEDAKAAEKM